MTLILLILCIANILFIVGVVNTLKYILREKNKNNISGSLGMLISGILLIGFVLLINALVITAIMKHSIN